MTTNPGPSILELTPLNETYRVDPHQILDDVRARCPVYKDPLSGSVLISRYEDVRSTVNNRELWRDPARAEEGALLQRRDQYNVDPDAPKSTINSILTLDEPDHSRIRQPLSQALYARVAKFKPQVEAIVDAALDRLEGQPTFDLMAGFCVPVPIDVIAAILGVDHDRLVEFRDWSEGAIQGLNPFRNAEQTAHMETSSLALNDYFTALIEARRAAYRRPLRRAAVEPPVPYLEESLSFLANVYNAAARRFYEKHGVKLIAAAYEAHEETGEVPLMITRHCLRYSFSLCPKQAKGVTGVQGQVRAEPMVLIHGHDKLRLEFDCRACEMHVVGKIRKHRLAAR